MTADLPAVARSLAAPARAVRGARYLSRGALSNAGRSLAELRQAITDRASLVRVLDEPAGPGDLEGLSERECWELLARQTVGRLAYVARTATPDIAPVNYVLDDRSVLIRSGAGPKLQAAERRDRVAFEVDELDREAHGAWSVVVYGRAELVLPDAHLDVLPATWASGPRRHVLRVVPSRVTGRRLHATT